MYNRMESELVASVFECYFEDADYEFKDITEMSLKQLVIYKKQLIDLNDGNKLTKSQKEIFDTKFKADIWNEYPATLYNATEAEALKDNQMRNLEGKKFKAECIKINKTLFENSKSMLLKIEELEIQLKEQSETKYKADQKIYANAKCICECGMETIRKNKSTHKKSKFHLAYETKEAQIQEEKLKKCFLIKERKEIELRTNNGYNLDDDGKIVWPLDPDGNRMYLKDVNGKNIYPKNNDGHSIWMKDAKGITITPEEEKCAIKWF